MMRVLVLKLYAALMKARSERDWEAAAFQELQADRDMWRQKAMAGAAPGEAGTPRSG
jgi:hypothetical protein